MTWRDADLAGVPRPVAGSRSPASWPTRSTWPRGTGRGVGGDPWPPASRSASPPTAPRRCTCCAPRRATRSSARTPTAPSPRRTSGMEWIVSKAKPDFIGKRSLRRVENEPPERKQLVGLLPVDRDAAARGLADRRAATAMRSPPVPMLGHVTSSYRSAALGRTFALALVKAGQATHRRDGAPAARRGPDSRRGHWLGAVRPEECAVMADTERISLLKPWAKRFAQQPDAVTIAEEPHSHDGRTPRRSIRPRRGRRGASAWRRAADYALHLHQNDDTEVIWLGPDEWLLTAPH